MRKQLIIVSALALTLLGFVAWMAMESTIELQEGGAWLAHTNNVLAQLATVRQRLNLSRTQALYFVITEDPIFRDRQDAAESECRKALGTLYELTSDNDVQSKEFQHLSDLVYRRLASDHTLINRKQRVEDYGREQIFRDYRSGLLDELSASIAHMEIVQNGLQEERTEKVNRSMLATRVRIGIGSVVAALMVGLAATALLADIRRRQRAEAERAASELTLRSFFDSSPCMMGIAELHGDDVLHVSDNRQTALVAGMSSEQMVGKRSGRDLNADPESLKVWVEHYRKAQQTGEIVRFEHALPSPRGLRWISAIVSQLPSEPGAAPRFAYVAEDATQRIEMDRRLREAKNDLDRQAQELRENAAQLQQAREAAEAASVAKSLFLANTSHEVRTPLTAILGFTEILLNDSVDPVQRQSYLDTIHRNGKHLLNVINDVLDFSKIEADRLEVQVAPFELSTVLAELLSTFRVVSAEKNLQLNLTFNTPVPKVMVSDRRRFNQILLNLLGNAIKFTPSGEVAIGLSYEAERDRLSVAVQDTGVGIAPEQFNRLFEPFVQADDSLTRRFSGTGLGLTISRRLARMLGGDIRVESVVDKGSTFTLTLTARAQGEARLASMQDLVASPVSAQGEAPDRLPGGGRVLVVDDGKDNRTLIGAILRHVGVGVELVINGSEAVEEALRQPYDLILMDMQMPVMDGYIATRRLREAGLKTPIVALTAHALPEDRERCLAAGCTDFLTKPVPRDLLLRTVQRYLGSMAIQALSSGSVVSVGSGMVPSAADRHQNDSLYAADPVIGPLLDKFIKNMHQQGSELARLITADRAAAAQMAHQIKGAAGAFGYPELTRRAAVLEAVLKTESGDVGSALDEVTSFISHWRAASQPV